MFVAGVVKLRWQIEPGNLLACIFHFQIIFCWQLCNRRILDVTVRFWEIVDFMVKRAYFGFVHFPCLRWTLKKLMAITFFRPVTWFYSIIHKLENNFVKRIWKYYWSVWHAHFIFNLISRNAHMLAVNCVYMKVI